jgi:hypothetical protein
MDIFAQAARLNNQGVTAFLQGDDKNAVAALTQSIKTMKQAVMSSKPSYYSSEKNRPHSPMIANIPQLSFQASKELKNHITSQKLLLFLKMETKVKSILRSTVLLWSSIWLSQSTVKARTERSSPRPKGSTSW